MVLKQPPALETLGLQILVVLTQKLHSLVILSQTFITVPLAPQLGGHTRGDNGPLHPELLRGTVGSAVTLCRMFVGVKLQYDVRMSQ